MYFRKRKSICLAIRLAFLQVKKLTKIYTLRIILFLIYNWWSKFWIIYTLNQMVSSLLMRYILFWSDDSKCVYFKLECGVPYGTDFSHNMYRVNHTKGHHPYILRITYSFFIYIVESAFCSNTCFKLCRAVFSSLKYVIFEISQFLYLCYLFLIFYSCVYIYFFIFARLYHCQYLLSIQTMYFNFIL